MNDIVFSLGTLEALHKEAQREDMTFAERAGLYAAIVVMCDKFRSFVEGEGGDGYALEKIHQYEWYLAAALGFDITNGHSTRQHLSWSAGALDSLRDVLTRDDTSA